MDNGAISYQRFLDGDDEGIVEIIRDYKDGLILYLSGITGNIVYAEEIMEDTFFRLVTKKPRFSGRSSFKTWLYSIGRNSAIDSLRNKSRFSDIPVDEYINLADELSIERDYLKYEQKILLHRALQKLNPDYRQVLYLIFFENFSNSETAKIMHKTKRQVENLLYRAKQSLKSELEKEGFEYEVI
ncbi:MAG: RNA polymerase sigma factor [Ruminococcus sp.]|nr:RNA polymerase sigma factor [Ruminococcus sp.]MDE6677891.1 RNA polymerase sigma factor [Ruminococcus sp.]